MAKEETSAESTSERVFSKDEIRFAILSAPTEDEVLSVFGVQVEVRSPALEDLMQYRNASTDDSILARAIVNNVYVPGTGERVFTEADIPELMKTRFSPDMRKLNKAVQRVLGGDEEILQEVDSQTKSNKE